MRYRLNPCDMDRFRVLAPVGDALAAFFDTVIYRGTDGCPCCMAVRIIALAAVTFAVGVVL